MLDFEDSSLWRVSDFERERLNLGNSAFTRLDGPTLLPTTLLADLQRLHDDPAGSEDVLEFMAACMRHRESALLCLQYEGRVWPVTLFPAERLYHSPRDLTLASASGLANLKVITCEPPGVRPPGHREHERIAQPDHYRSLPALLWLMAMRGPRSSLLVEIGGTAAYRALPNPDGERLPAPGAIGSAIERLRRESASLREIATWPGLSIERASRLLNALYLSSSLVIARTHPAARSEPGSTRRWFGFGKRK